MWQWAKHLPAWGWAVVALVGVAVVLAAIVVGGRAAGGSGGACSVSEQSGASGAYMEINCAHARNTPTSTFRRTLTGLPAGRTPGTWHLRFTSGESVELREPARVQPDGSVRVTVYALEGAGELAELRFEPR